MIKTKQKVKFLGGFLTKMHQSFIKGLGFYEPVEMSTISTMLSDDSKNTKMRDHVSPQF